MASEQSVQCSHSGRLNYLGKSGRLFNWLQFATTQEIHLSPFMVVPWPTEDRWGIIVCVENHKDLPSLSISVMWQHKHTWYPLSAFLHWNLSWCEQLNDAIHKYVGTNATSHTDCTPQRLCVFCRGQGCTPKCGRIFNIIFVLQRAILQSSPPPSLKSNNLE